MPALYTSEYSSEGIPPLHHHVGFEALSFPHKIFRDMHVLAPLAPWVASVSPYIKYSRLGIPMLTTPFVPSSSLSHGKGGFLVRYLTIVRYYVNIHSVEDYATCQESLSHSSFLALQFSFLGLFT